MALTILSYLIPWTTGFIRPAASVAALWVVWYFLTFDKRSPFFDPKSPKPLPYWVPFFGHVVGMGRNSGYVFRAGRKYVADKLGTHSIWSLTVMGEEMYIVSGADDVGLVYAQKRKLDADSAVRDVLKDFGVSDKSLDKIFDDQDGNAKHWMDECHDHFRTQMIPKDNGRSHFNDLETTFLGNINASLKWDRIKGSMLSSNTETTKTVSLWRWCHEVLVDSATLSFFGKAIYEQYADIVADFFIFDAEAWKLPYRLPKPLARRMYDAKARGEAGFAKYLALPPEKRRDSSWIVRTIQEGLADLDIHEPKECGALLFSLHRVANSNAYRLCFWSLAFLLHDPSLLQTIREEIQPALKDDGLDMNCLVDKCPKLNSFYLEIMRWTNDPISIRLVKENVAIGQTMLKPGRKLIMPYRPMHYDTNVFGDNTEEFDALRFFKNKKLEHHKTFRPFGGGAMHCPGRVLAKREVYMFVVLALTRFDMKLVSQDGGEPKMPTLDETIPSGGILPPKPGHDVIVELREAKRA